MFIKSVIRGGYRSAAEYMKEQGKNEKTRLVEISDPSAKNLDDAFHNMWVVASGTKCTKPLHHISINPVIGERLTDEQLMKIVEHAEEIYGYKMFHHQRVIVEHIKDGRQHFHVIWNRVSLMTGRPVWPGMHWKKSKQICREMEKRLGLKSPLPRQKKCSSKPHTRCSKTTFPKRGYSRSSSTKGTKYRNYVKHGRSHTSPNSSAGVLTMLNRLSRQTRKRKASWALFNKHNNHHHRHAGSISHAGAGFPSAWQSQPLALPKIILFKPTTQPEQQSPMSSCPARPQGGWPPAAILDWGLWGHKNPRRFFALWPELAR